MHSVLLRFIIDMQTFNPDHIGILLFLRFPKDSIPFSTVYFIWRFFWVGNFHLRGWWWVPKSSLFLQEASVGTALGAAFCAFQRLSGVRRKAPSGARGAKRLAAATGRASRTWGEHFLGGFAKNPDTHSGVKNLPSRELTNISPIFFGTFESMIFLSPWWDVLVS